MRAATPQPAPRDGAAGSARPPSSAPAPRPSQRPSRIPFPSVRLDAFDYDLANAARRVIGGALGVVRGERVTLLVDREHRDVGSALFETARELGAEPIVHELESHGDRPMKNLPDPVRAALGRSQASVLAIGFEDGEVGMRIELLDAVKAMSLRHAHLIGVSRRSLIAGFSVDHARVLDMTRAVRTRLRPDSRFRVRTPAGTDLEVRLDPTVRWMEHVGVIRPGKWENLPSGRLTTCPAMVRGVFVCDASLGGHFGAAAGLAARTQVRVEVEASLCRSVASNDRALQREVESFLAREHHLSRVGGVIVGTNVGILSATGDIVADQNMPGLHVMFGQSLPDGYGATWSTRAQLPMACSGADVDLDGVPVMRAGRYLIA
jgi:leucyl aminopeptidase (aminopeptidase T)